MRVLVSGHDGYIGCALVPRLRAAGHEVVGLDSFLFGSCAFGREPDPVPCIGKDVRDVGVGDLEGFDAVVHLAAISNDPLGDLNPATTYDINHRGAVHLAAVAKAAGVGRFAFSSSCSLYGAAGDDALTEEAAFNPVTPYGRSKVLAEADIGALADDSFTPTFLRNGTAYGVSARLRIDLVVNNLVGLAVATGRVEMRSDGSPLRPLVHIEDISRAFEAVLAAPRELVHKEAFNVGRSQENYRIRDVALLVEEEVAGSRVSFAAGAGPDARNYRVDCDKIATVLPAYRPTWTVRDGVKELRDAYLAAALTEVDVTGPRYLRIHHIEELLERGDLDASLRWRAGRPVDHELVEAH
jgi:nucleoside-diphosphate-sugar epimerase